MEREGGRESACHITDRNDRPGPTLTHTYAYAYGTASRPQAGSAQPSRQPLARVHPAHPVLLERGTYCSESKMRTSWKSVFPRNSTSFTFSPKRCPGHMASFSENHPSVIRSALSRSMLLSA